MKNKDKSHKNHINKDDDTVLAVVPYSEYDDEDPDMDDSDQCCDYCGCYHGHHPWCDDADDY